MNQAVCAECALVEHSWTGIRESIGTPSRDLPWGTGLRNQARTLQSQAHHRVGPHKVVRGLDEVLES
jgi:hypothetical protein